MHMKDFSFKIVLLPLRSTTCGDVTRWLVTLFTEFIGHKQEKELFWLQLPEEKRLIGREVSLTIRQNYLCLKIAVSRFVNMPTHENKTMSCSTKSQNVNKYYSDINVRLCSQKFQLYYLSFNLIIRCTTVTL